MQIPGIIHRSTLLRTGVDRRDMVELLRGGGVRRLHPWYLQDEAPADLVRLLELGVRPTCIDAAVLHGLFTPPHDGVHVYKPRMTKAAGSLREVRTSQVRRRSGGDVAAMHRQSLVFHGPQLRTWPDDDPVPDLPLVLDHAARCLPTVQAAVLLESAINRRRMSLDAARQLVAGLPFHARRPLEGCVP